MKPGLTQVMIDPGNAPAHGGIGVFAYGLMEGLRTFASDEIGVVPCLANVPSRSFRWLHRLDYFQRMYRLRLRGFDGADLVHFANSRTPQRRPGVRFLSSVHDIDAVRCPGLYSAQYRMYASGMFAGVIRRAHMIHTVSHATRGVFLDRYHVDEGRVVTIHPALSPQLIACAAATAMPQESNIPTILFVGALTRKKNVAWLIRTTVEGVQRGALPRLRLILAGNPSFGFEEIEAELRVSRGMVEVANNPGLEELVNYYRAASVVVLPSVSEGFGFPLIEAMFFDKPLVASRIPSSVEVAGEAALFFDLDDKEGFYHAMKTALEDAQREKRREAASRMLPEFQWRHLIPLYVKLYRQCLCEQ